MNYSKSLSVYVAMWVILFLIVDVIAAGFINRLHPSLQPEDWLAFMIIVLALNSYVLYGAIRLFRS